MAIKLYSYTTEKFVIGYHRMTLVDINVFGNLLHKLKLEYVKYFSSLLFIALSS